MSERSEMFMRYCVLAQRLLEGAGLSPGELREYERLRERLFG